MLNELNREGHQAVLVGGCVRDLLLGRAINDWDVATSATPGEVQQLFHHTVPTGIKHGTITVQIQGLPTEVTTFRTEGSYSDGRHPDVVRYTSSLDEDLKRRDFTLNAMALTIHGELIDPFGGQQDLAQGLIRAVGRPQDRFSEDALRILRGLRLAAELGFRIGPDTLDAMKDTAPGLSHIAGERIGQEFRRLFEAWHGATMAILASGPWLGHLPVPWSDSARPLATVAARLINPPVQTDRWQAVLSLVAWRAGWREADVHQAARVFAWPKDGARCAVRLTSLLVDDPLRWSETDWQRKLFQFGRGTVEQACLLLDAWEPPGGRRILPFREACARQRLWSSRELAVSGTDLLKLGLTGPQIGAGLRRLVDDVLSGSVDNTRQQLLWCMDEGKHGQGGARHD